MPWGGEDPPRAIRLSGGGGERTPTRGLAPRVGGGWVLYYRVRMYIVSIFAEETGIVPDACLPYWGGAQFSEAPDSI